MLAAGLWLITLPGCTVVETCWVERTLKPAAVSSAAAVAWSWPTTLGTCFLAWPEEMNSVTAVPTPTVWPAAGSVAIALPAGYCCEVWLSMRDLSFDRLSSRRAAVSLSPTTDGIDVLPAPSETLSVTFDPLSALLPDDGSSPTTIPCGWRLLVTGTSETMKPARSSSTCATLY